MQNGRQDEGVTAGCRKGRPENLKKGKKKGEPPTRKLSEQKVKDFCWYYLTHGESVKAAGLHVGLSPTYVYEFFNKPPVQKMLESLRLQLDELMLEKAAGERICSRQFIDEILGRIAIVGPHPRRGFSDQIAALRLAADIAGLTRKREPSNAAQLVDCEGEEVYIPIEDRRRAGIVDERCDEIDRQFGFGAENEQLATDAGVNIDSEELVLPSVKCANSDQD